MKALITVKRGTKGLNVRPRCIGTAWSLPFGAILFWGGEMCLESLYLGDKGTTIVRNVGKYSLNDTASHPTRLGYELCFT
jgi:hypothetical protein